MREIQDELIVRISAVEGRLDALFHSQSHIIKVLKYVQREEELIMSTMDQVLQDVTDESTRLDSLSTFIDGLKKQIADALAGVTLSPAVQAKVDSVFTITEANKGKLDAALNTNVPPPVVTPPVV